MGWVCGPAEFGVVDGVNLWGETSTAEWRELTMPILWSRPNVTTPEAHAQGILAYQPWRSRNPW
jgi:hypothetical protein